MSLYGDLRRRNIPMRANDNVSDHITPERLEAIRSRVSSLVGLVLEELLIDWRNDTNMSDTPRRYSKMLVEEVMSGRYLPAPPVTSFPNTKKLDEMYTTGPITVRSMCSHHMVPIVGKAWIGVIPGERVIGLSKFNRLVEWICRRPQIQEEMVVQVADELEKHLAQPKGLAVVIEASHMCMTWRGVEEADAAVMRTNVVRGRFRESDAARAEFFSSIK